MTIPAVLLLLLGTQSPKHLRCSWALRQLGFNAAKAVLTEIYPLLNYDRSDLRADDEVSLGDKKSDLYCFYSIQHVSSGKGRPCTRNCPRRTNWVQSG